MESYARVSKPPADGLEGSSPISPGWRRSRGAYPYPPRGYSRGGRAQVHRNRTLVLNGSNASPSSGGENPEGAVGNTTASQGWVTKTDRHLQLINTSIFEKESQNRAKALEETRQQKLKQRDEREKARFSKHLERLGGNIDNSSDDQIRLAGSPGNYEMIVQGIRFRVAKNGSKLVKVPGESLRPA
jgi:hypothetical protein